MYLGGGTGISTGNDGKFLKPTSEVKNNPKWVGYYKNGIRGAYHYEPTMFIEKDYKKHAEKVSNFMLRNEQFFFKEGITCSSVGVNFSVSYMPPGNLFGVNANFFAENKTELYYALGLLNSKIAIYILKKVFNRTNNVSSKYIKRLPYLSPTKEKKEAQSLTLLSEQYRDVSNALNRVESEYATSKRLYETTLGKVNPIDRT